MKRILIILLALILDLSLGDPPNRFHPVVLMGNWLTNGRRLAPNRHHFWFGMGWTIAGVALFALPWLKLEFKRKLSFNIYRLPPHLLSLMLHSFLLKSVFAYRNLRQNVINVGQALVDNNLSQARELTGRHLVSRNTHNLTAEEVAGAAIESLAENLTDSVTAPLMAYAVGSLPAAWAYRFINTADAMWGYRSAEFEQLGKFPARLDDVLNWFPARMTGWLLMVAAWLAGEDAAGAKQVMLTQHNQTTSPNAGWTMSAMAGALGITLSKHDAYQLEGGSRLPTMTIIDRALRLADVCLGLSIAIICSGLMIFDIWRRKYL